MSLFYKPSAGDIITDGLVSRWTFEDEADTTTLTDVYGSNDGSINGMTYTADSTVEGSHVGSFDGTDDNVQIGQNASLNTTGNITVSFWFKRPSISDGQPISKRINSTDDGWLFYFGKAGQESRMTWWYDGTLVRDPDGTAEATGTWHHAAGVFDSGTIRLFINGSKVDYTAVSALNTDDGELWFGGEPNQGPFYGGDLDDVRLYHRALSDAEISNIAAGKG